MSSLPSPNQSNRLPIWFQLLLGLGGPIAAGLTITQTATQHPWQALGIALLYVTMVLVLGTVTKVWQQLENNWVNQIVDWINNRPRNYQKRYCQWLIAQHNQLDIGGLSIYGTPLPTLEQVFIDLNLVVKPPYQISPAMFKASEASSASQHPIPYYIEQGHLVLLGLPGSGKTTLLKNLGLTLISRKKQSKALKTQYKLPFFLSLRDYGNTIKEQEQFSLVDAVQAPLRKWNRSTPPGWVENCLNKGGCLVLLDGLDEVPDEETRLAMANWVQQQMVTYGLNNRFILTSRPYGYQNNPLNGVIVLEVQGFTYRQIREFVHNWYSAEEANRSKYALETFDNTRIGAEGFLEKLNNTPTLFDLARNPLLLTMSILVHRYRGSLPGSRGELYKEICNTFLGGRQRAKGLRLELSPEQNQLVLQPLAFYMMKQQKTELTLAEAQSIIEEPLKTVSTQLQPPAFLKIIEDSNFWVKQGLDVYGFAHLSFQEYLAAMYVKEKNLKQVLVDQLESSWWRETIILYCNRADASPIIKACLTDRPLSEPVLQLALECEEAASRSSSIDDPSVRTLFDNILVQGAEDTKQEIRKIVAEARLAQRIKKMIALDDNIYVTSSLISCAEYQLFLDKQQLQRKHYQPDHWTDVHFPSGQGLAPVLGVRPSDALAFCAWLTERDQEGWHYRLPYANELKKVEGSIAVAAGTGYWINGGKGFVWAKGDSHLSSEATQEFLDHFFTNDTNRALNYSFDRSDRSQHNMAEYADFARNLAHARSLNNDLVRVLTSTRSYIYDRECILQTLLESAHEDKVALQARLTKAQNQQRRLIYLQRQANTLQAQLDSAKEQKSTPQTQLDDIQAQLDDIQEQERTLQAQLDDEHELTNTLQTLLANAQEQENTLQAQFDHFSAQAHAFYSICNQFLDLTPVYSNSDALSSALSRNEALNLDRILARIYYDISEEARIKVSSLVSTFTKALALSLAHYRSDTDINIDNYTRPNDIALVNQLNQIPFSDNVLRLTRILEHYLSHITRRRPFGKKGHSLTRLYIRYFARELALHFAYWTWKELLSDAEQSSQSVESIVQRTIDTYFDISVAFAILEGRIEGKLPASEGILIVKERLEENQEKDE